MTDPNPQDIEPISHESLDTTHKDSVGEPAQSPIQDTSRESAQSTSQLPVESPSLPEVQQYVRVTPQAQPQPLPQQQAFSPLAQSTAQPQAQQPAQQQAFSPQQPGQQPAQQPSPQPSPQPSWAQSQQQQTQQPQPQVQQQAQQQAQQAQPYYQTPSYQQQGYQAPPQTAQRAVPPQAGSAQQTQQHPSSHYASPHYSAQHVATPASSAYHQHTAAYPQTQKQKSRGSSKGMAFVMGLIGVLVGAAIAFGVSFAVTDGFKPAVITEASQDTNYTGAGITVTPPAEDASLAEVVAAKTLPSVVNIDVYTTSGGGYYGDFDSRTDNSGALEEYGLGSGIVISADGYILTNDHVVEGGTEYLVRFTPEEQYKATVVGKDPTSDLAVLKVDATGLTPIEIGDSSKTVVGQWVMALGSPFGLEKSVSTGIVSALFRSTTMQSTAGTNFYANMIQTDAAINPGNSGGALVNAEGKLIGVNTLISSNSGTSSGVGFAIPSNYAMNVAQQIMDGKEVEHAFLGVQLRTVDVGNASSFNSNVEAGAYIGQVVSGSPADLAGLQEGDIVTKMDDTLILSAAELVINVRGHFVGDVIKLEIQRDGQTQSINVTLGSDKS
jgi:putative serine protease PepD